MTNVMNVGKKKINLFLFFMVSAVTPSEPTNFQMSLVEQVYIRVKWDPPRSTVPVVFYRIFYKPKMSKEQYVVVSHDRIIEQKSSAFLVC